RSEHELALWEKQVNALFSLLVDPARRVLTTDELRRGIEALGPGEYDHLGYYERWIRSITNNLLEKGIFTADELGRKLAEIKAREAPAPCPPTPSPATAPPSAAPPRPATCARRSTSAARAASSSASSPPFRTPRSAPTAAPVSLPNPSTASASASRTSGPITPARPGTRSISRSTSIGSRNTKWTSRQEDAGAAADVIRMSRSARLTLGPA